MIALFAQPTDLRIVDVLAKIGSLCTNNGQQLRPALDVLTFAAMDCGDRSIARRRDPGDAFGRNQEPDCMLLPGVIVGSNEQRHRKHAECNETGDQRKGTGKSNSDLASDPEALVIDRFLPEEFGGHRTPLEPSRREHAPARLDCAARSPPESSVGSPSAPTGRTNGRPDGSREAGCPGCVNLFLTMCRRLSVVRFAVGR